tara:strand:- start:1196 stop:1594 length:399 start_codon:yes stop_codon:yes gene_type:complete
MSYQREPTRAETEVYIDADVLIEQESQVTVGLEELIRERQMKYEEAKAADERRKEIDNQLKDFIDAYSAGGLVLKTWVVDKINRKGSGRWNTNKLMRMLTPEQIEEAYSEGSPSSHVRVVADEERAEKARAG